jgi:hypothetical protein
MKTNPACKPWARARSRPACLFAVILAGAAWSSAEDNPPVAGTTVLETSFEAKLSDPRLAWPSPESTAAVVATKYPQCQQREACRWQDITLQSAFRAGACPGSEEAPYTPGVSADGYDAVYHRWESAGYRLQLCCTRGMLFVMAEPKSVPGRPKLSARDVQQRTETAVAEIVRRGPQLLANSTMKLEPTPYGYQIRFRQDAKQRKALARDTTDRPAWVTDQWLTMLDIRTDGYSFVFDFPKIGPGPAAPSPEKTWFDERTPPSPP